MGQLLFPPLFPSHSDMIKAKEVDEKQIHSEILFNQKRRSRLILFEGSSLCDCLKEETLSITSKQKRMKIFESTLEHIVQEYEDETIDHLFNVVEVRSDHFSRIELYGPLDLEMEILLMCRIREIAPKKRTKLKGILKKLRKNTKVEESTFHFSKQYNSKEYILLKHCIHSDIFDREMRCIESCEIMITDISLRHFDNVQNMLEIIDKNFIHHFNVKKFRGVVLFTDAETILNSTVKFESVKDSKFRPELSQCCQWNGFREQISSIISKVEEFCNLAKNKQYFMPFEYHILSGTSDSSIMQIIVQNIELIAQNSEWKVFVSPTLLHSHFSNQKLAHIGDYFADVIFNCQEQVILE